MLFNLRQCSMLALLATVIPYAAAHGGQQNNNNNNGCKSNEFWYKNKGCCLPHGGVQNPPKPPKGSDCPPSGYYWGNKQACCVPQHPPPEEAPEPQCRTGWKWSRGEFRCCEEPSKPPAPPPKPSPQPQPGHPGPGPAPGHGPAPGPHHKRNLKARVKNLCPTGLEACPIPGGLSGDFECLDTTYELESCGGCTALGKGQDCTAIKGAWNVGCEQGSCEVYTCTAGYARSTDGKSCIAA